MTSRSHLGLCSLLVIALHACSTQSVDEQAVGRATLSLSAIPAAVRCVQVVVAGVEKSAIRKLDVNAGATLMATLTGLPVGSVTFAADAFADACSKLSPSSPSGWSASPVMAVLSSGTTAEVSLVLRPAGSARVGVSFDESSVCSNALQACAAHAECCSGACDNGKCVGGPVVGGSPPAPLSCAELVHCYEACAGQDCQRCNAASMGNLEFEALVVCINEACPDPQQYCTAACNECLPIVTTCGLQASCDAPIFTNAR